MVLGYTFLRLTERSLSAEVKPIVEVKYLNTNFTDYVPFHIISSLCVLKL